MSGSFYSVKIKMSVLSVGKLSQRRLYYIKKTNISDLSHLSPTKHKADTGISVIKTTAAENDNEMISSLTFISNSWALGLVLDKHISYTQ